MLLVAGGEEEGGSGAMPGETTIARLSGNTAVRAEITAEPNHGHQELQVGASGPNLVDCTV